MTITLQAHGGGAQPASIDTSGKITGGVALRVYGFDSAEDAQAAGYICEGGPAMSVALITDAQIASGAWKAEGDPSALVVYTAPASLPVEGGYAVPVYAVNGWGSPAPAPVPPLFSSAEVGTVNASTVAVTFDQDVSASDYSAGVTIKVNGSGATISSATRQANHAIVYYVLSAAAVFGDVVTWEYIEASGNIVAEDDSTPLANVTAQSVTNNVADLGVALRADAIAYWKLDELTGARADSTTHGYTLSESGGEAGNMIGKIGNAFLGTKIPVRPLSNSDSAFDVSGVSFSFACWAFRNNDEFQVDIIGNEDNEMFTNRYVLGIDQPQNRFHFWCSVGNGSDYPIAVASSFGDVPLNEWIFIVCWFDLPNLTMNIQVNNGEIDSLKIVSPPDPNSFPIVIGAINTANPWTGGIDELGFWKRILTSDERTYLYNSGAGRALFPAP